MNLKDLLIRNRSYRRFYQRERISRDELEELVGLVRWCPSGRNAQPLRYVVAEEEELCERIFPVLGWAGYLKDWAGPEEGERPAAYLVHLLDPRVVRIACVMMESRPRPFCWEQWKRVMGGVLSNLFRRKS